MNDEPQPRESRRMPAEAVSLTIPVSGLTYPNRFTIPGYGDDEGVYTLTAPPSRRTVTSIKDGVRTDRELAVLKVSYPYPEGGCDDNGATYDVLDEMTLNLDVQVKVIW